MQERRPWAVLVLLMALLLASPAARAVASPPDDALTMAALDSGDVFVSARELGEVAPVDADRLRTLNVALAERGYAVKFALLASLGGVDPFVYAESIRRRLAYDGTVLVTTLHGRVGAAGVRDRADLRAALRNVDGVRHPSPVARLAVASELSLPPPPDGRSPWKGLAVLIGLALLGAGWSVTWGMRREQRRTRAVTAEERAKLKVALDALSARAEALAARADLPPDARLLVEEAVTHHAAGMVAVEHGSSVPPHDGVAALHAGLECLARGADIAGRPFSPERPYAGLCGADPAHGDAVDSATLVGEDTPVPVCAACADRARDGDPPWRRQVPRAGRPVPFDQAGLPMVEDAPAAVSAASSAPAPHHAPGR